MTYWHLSWLIILSSILYLLLGHRRYNTYLSQLIMMNCYNDFCENIYLEHLLLYQRPNRKRNELIFLILNIHSTFCNFWLVTTFFFLFAGKWKCVLLITNSVLLTIFHLKKEEKNNWKIKKKKKGKTVATKDNSSNGKLLIIRVHNLIYLIWVVFHILKKNIYIYIY